MSSCYIFAGGGTGGHLYPGLAVAAEVLHLQGDARIVFACSDRAIDQKILGPLAYKIIPQPIKPLPSSLGAILPFWRAYKASMKLAESILAEHKPAAVLGLGGFAAAPMVAIADKRGVRSGMLNPDAVPGKANKMLAKHAQIIFTQFGSTAECFAPQLREKVRRVGCPIRPAFAKTDRNEAMTLLGLDPDKNTLLVFGGSLLAESISDAVEALAGDLKEFADRWQVLHISASPKAAGVEHKLAASGVATKTLAYCDRMELAYAAANLVLGRGGAGTVAEVAATGRAAVIMPYPHHKDQQQKLNAQELVRASAAVLCEDLKDPAANAAALRTIMLPILRDGAKLDRMKAASATLGQTEAAKDVARWLVGNVWP